MVRFSRSALSSRAAELLRSSNGWKEMFMCQQPRPPLATTIRSLLPICLLPLPLLPNNRLSLLPHFLFHTPLPKPSLLYLSSTFISTSSPPIFLLPLLASDLLTDSNACDVMLRNGALYQHSVSLLGMWNCDIKNVSNCLDFCRLGQDKGQQSVGPTLMVFQA